MSNHQPLRKLWWCACVLLGRGWLETGGDDQRGHDAAGHLVQDNLRDIAEIRQLNLGEVDRLAALAATRSPAVASTHHSRHKAVYLEAVRAWSLEISVGLAPPPVRLARFSSNGPVEEGAEILVAGLDGLLDGLAARRGVFQDRLVMELSLSRGCRPAHDP